MLKRIFVGIGVFLMIMLVAIVEILEWIIRNLDMQRYNYFKGLRK